MSATFADTLLRDSLVVPPRGPAPADGTDAAVRADDLLIRLRGVTKTYGRGQAAFKALKGVDLDIERGDFVAIMGPSGSGKSTAMNTLGCLDVPTGASTCSAAWRCRGSAATSAPACAASTSASSSRASTCSRAPRRWRTSSCRCSTAARAHRCVTNTRARRSPRSAWRDGKHHTPAELSGGQQQRVAIARAIVTNPEVLLADEPTGNLDTQRGREIMELLWQLNSEQGITVLMVTHEPDMAAYAKRVVRFVDGQVASDRRNPRPAGLDAPHPAAASADTGGA